jgi:uncharacterized protein (DUF697 family)
MSRLASLGNIFRTLREVDLEAIRRNAEKVFHLALVGEPGAGKTTLLRQMRSGGREGEHLPAFVGEYDLPAAPPGNATAAILVVDASHPVHEDGVRLVLERLRDQGVPVLVCLNKADLVAGQEDALLADWQARTSAEVVLISALEREALVRKLVPAVLRLMPGHELALARALPLFRKPVTQHLIEETSLANAGYSLTTGLVEIIPALNLPFNAGDIVVLTKNQAIMAYKIALAMGLPADWRETLPQLGAVIGGGFMWRQIARELVGLIPIWGIVPKVAVAYAGTRVTGLAVYHWAATGEKLAPRALKERYRQALDQGRELARRLIARRRKPPLLAPGT